MKFYSRYLLPTSIYLYSLLVRAQDVQTAETTENAATAPAPIPVDKFEHVELNGIFISVGWVLAFLVVIFIVLKYFIYLPDEKRKDIE